MPAEGWLAADSVQSNPARTAATAAALIVALSVGTLLTIGVVSVVMGVLAAILPARRAARLDPPTALSYE